MTFRRHVRRLVMPVSEQIPLEMVQGEMRRQLNESRHSVLEQTWDDNVHFGAMTYDFIVHPYTTRAVSVRYVTGGMRHGLSASLFWVKVPDVVEFPGRAVSREAMSKLERVVG